MERDFTLRWISRMTLAECPEGARGGEAGGGPGVGVEVGVRLVLRGQCSKTAVGRLPPPKLLRNHDQRTFC